MALLVIIISLALIFDFINGFHDAANAIATIVSTKVLTPFQAVVWAAAFNFAAFFLLTHHHVANTIAKAVNAEFVTLPVILAGLIAAIIWNLITWWFGIPSSSSHTLIGGFAGAGMTNAVLKGESAFNAVNRHDIGIIFAFIVLAPVFGLVISYFVTWCVRVICKDVESRHVQRFFKTGQLVSSAALSFAHGGNDAQKVMGIIYIALATSHVIAGDADMPAWISLACYTAIALGTMTGGWRIVKTMGTKITRITPLKGVTAESAGALILLATEHFGIPVSTTHTMTGAIIGAGLTDRAAVQWKTVTRLIYAWIITIPVSAFFAALIYGILYFAGA